MRTLLLLVALLQTGCVRVQVRSGAPAADDARGVAEALLARGARAWSAGDLDGFMRDYADSATFVTPRGLVSGRDRIRALYAPRFAPGVARDALRFEHIAAYPLGEDVIHVVAWYVLERDGRETSRGPTSLVLRRVEGRWVIVHDHSS